MKCGVPNILAGFRLRSLEAFWFTEFTTTKTNAKFLSSNTLHEPIRLQANSRMLHTNESENVNVATAHIRVRVMWKKEKEACRWITKSYHVKRKTYEPLNTNTFAVNDFAAHNDTSNLQVYECGRFKQGAHTQTQPRTQWNMKSKYERESITR